MKRLLLDTQVLLWLLFEPTRLPESTRHFLLMNSGGLVFSIISIWEVANKQKLKKSGFTADAREVHRQLVAMKFVELGLKADHTIATLALPLVHRDPFDRMLLAQAIVENLTLVTADKELAEYSGPILRV